MKFLFNCWLSGLVVGAGMSLFAQTTPAGISVAPFSEAGVTFQPYNRVISPTLARLVEENPRAARLIPQAAILGNDSGKDIVLVTVRWITPAPEKVFTFRQDGLFLGAGKAVAPRGSKLLVTPEGTWLDSGTSSPTEVGLMASASAGVGTGPASAREAIAAAKAAAESGTATVMNYASVELDTVVFADGTFIGPDRSETIASVRVRKEVATTIAREMLTALDTGGDVDGILGEYAKRLPQGETDHVNEWYGRIARLALHGPPASRRSLAGQLLAIPDIGNLRKSN